MGMTWYGPLGNTPLFIDLGTARLTQSFAPGITGATRIVSSRDEVSPIAQYMAIEMTRNANGADASRMRELNAFSVEACITDFKQTPLLQQLLGLGIDPQQCVQNGMTYRQVAMLIWASKVRQGGDWDHKPKIAMQFPTTSPFGKRFFHVHGNRQYYYDIWSNIHYGYVGMAAGFGRDALLDGASAEQIVSTLLRGAMPQSSTVDGGLTTWDDPTDRAAIIAGFMLYGRDPHSVAAADLLAAVTGNAGLRSEAYP